MRRILVPMAAAAALLTTGCSSGDISPTALQRSVGTAYQRLFLLQQHELGHSVDAPDSAATCARSGSTAHSGPGSWTCTVHYPYADGHLVPLSFDVEVQPIGCYVATGPATIVGQQRILEPTGHEVTNPLFAFDGCFGV
jgi:hypothetical protein